MGRQSQNHRQTDRDTERYRQRQTGKQTDRGRETERHRQRKPTLLTTAKEGRD